jgi:23S rRNA pseudouridine2605 synthase
MVEYYGTEVTKLKRIEYAGLDLKGVPPGRWRFLRDKEIVDLRVLVKLKPLEKVGYRKKSSVEDPKKKEKA